MIKYDNTINISRYLLLAGGVLGTLLELPIERYAFFIVFSLLLIANAQIRTLLTSSYAVYLSLGFDALALPFITIFFKGYTGLLVLVGLIDMLLMIHLSSKRYIAFLLYAGLLYGFSFIGFIHSPKAFPMALLFFLCLLLVSGLKKEYELKSRTEFLYDELKKNHCELEAAKASLMEYSKQVERITKLEERNRISRELHDSIGHSLTGILLQVDAALQILEMDKQKGMSILRSAYENINTSIETVRKTVRRLKPNTSKVCETSVHELITKFTQDTKVVVKLKTSGIPYEIIPSVKTVLYQNVKEALTNAVRHGEASHIFVHIIYKHDRIEAIVSDDGKGCTEIKKGFGLSGIEERLDMIGGKVSYNHKEGFEIRMVFPGKETA